jgi:hypothetical protein
MKELSELLGSNLGGLIGSVDPKTTGYEGIWVFGGMGYEGVDCIGIYWL